MIELVIKARNGDKSAFGILIEKHKQSMYKIARTYFSEPMDIDDAMGEAVLSCWKNIHTLREPKHFKTWLIRILINKCNEMASLHKDCVSLDSLSEYELPITQPEHSDDFSIIDAAEPKYRLVLLMYYGEGFKIREISDLTGLPQGTVSSQLKRGREQLAEKLAKEGLI